MSNTTIMAIVYSVLFLIFICALVIPSWIYQRQEKLAVKWLKDFRYNKDLANRFVSDYKLPISITNDEKIFIYQLHLYENSFSSLTKWIELWQLIDKRYDGNYHAFLDEYYQIRERIIQESLNNPAYQEFNNMNMSRFNVPKTNISKNNIYNGENEGKFFLSIDLKKANFQALRYVSPEIVKNAETYEDFIGTFTDLDYVKTSKYIRQVVFGKLNPSRHITVEKFLTNKVLDALRNSEFYAPYFEEKNIVSLSNDELIIKIDNFEVAEPLKDMSDYIKENTGVDTRTEVFMLKGYQLLSVGNDHTCVTFYRKCHQDSTQDKLMCVPGPYHTVIWKLFTGRKINEFDRYVNYDKATLCMFTEDFELKPLKGE